MCGALDDTFIDLLSCSTVVRGSLETGSSAVRRKRCGVLAMRRARRPGGCGRARCVEDARAGGDAVVRVAWRRCVVRGALKAMRCARRAGGCGRAGGDAVVRGGDASSRGALEAMRRPAARWRRCVVRGAEDTAVLVAMRPCAARWRMRPCAARWRSCRCAARWRELQGARRPWRSGRARGDRGRVGPGIRNPVPRDAVDRSARRGP